MAKIAAKVRAEISAELAAVRKERLARKAELAEEEVEAMQILAMLLTREE